MAAGGAVAGLSQSSSQPFGGCSRCEQAAGGLVASPGARALHNRRSIALLESASSDCRGGAFGAFTPYSNVIRDQRYRQVSQDPSAVRSWVRGHAPEGSVLVDSRNAPRRSGRVISYVIFDFSADKGMVAQRCLVVAIKGRADGEGSAIGVESQATWRLTRPHWDYVPRRVGVIAATHTIEHRSRRAMITDQRRVAQIATEINGARLSAPDPSLPRVHSRRILPAPVSSQPERPGRCQRDGPSHRVFFPVPDGGRSAWPSTDNPPPAMELLAHPPIPKPKPAETRSVTTPGAPASRADYGSCPDYRRDRPKSTSAGLSQRDTSLASAVSEAVDPNVDRSSRPDLDRGDRAGRIPDVEAVAGQVGPATAPVATITEAVMVRLTRDPIGAR